MKCIYCKNKLTMLDMVNDNTLECPMCGTHQGIQIECKYHFNYVFGSKPYEAKDNYTPNFDYNKVFKYIEENK